MTYNLKNTITAAVGAVFSAFIFVGASIAPATGNAASLVI